MKDRSVLVLRKKCHGTMSATSPSYGFDSFFPVHHLVLRQDFNRIYTNNRQKIRTHIHKHTKTFCRQAANFFYTWLLLGYLHLVVFGPCFKDCSQTFWEDIGRDGPRRRRRTRITRIMGQKKANFEDKKCGSRQ